MKIAIAFLGASLVANIVLGVAVHSRWSARDGRGERSASADRAMTTSTEASSAAAPAATAAAMSNASPPNLVELAALDDESYVARLRALGFPPELVRALVQARLGQRYADRMRKARRPREYAYWRGQMGSYDALSREERAAMRAISREMNEELRRLIGNGDAMLSPYEKARRALTLSFLPAEKIEQLDAINKDYGELMAAVRERTRGLVLSADREELRLLEREQRADLAALFTPEELLEYDLRASPTAGALRSRLTNFEPTEEEFRALVTLQLEVDQKYGRLNLSADEQVAKRAEEQALPAKFEAALGPERFAEFQITTDGSFRDTLSFMRETGFDREVAKEVIAVKRDVVQRADAIQKQRELTPAQRNEALAALEQETVQRLAARLDEKTLADYKKYSGGSWLARLRPRERPSNP